jgi:hypothetical protein
LIVVKNTDASYGPTPKRGVLVVENGNFTTQPNPARFEGLVIIRGGRLEDDDFESTGNLCLDGFANAEGDIKVRGSGNTGATPTCLIVSASMA